MKKAALKDGGKVAGFMYSGILHVVFMLMIPIFLNI